MPAPPGDDLNPTPRIASTPSPSATSWRPARSNSAPSTRSPRRPARPAGCYQQRAATLSLVATGGGLVFGGDSNGRFRAFDQETGEVLWEINLGSPVSGFPITYAVDGRQYVAVGQRSRRHHGELPRSLTPELRPSSGNNLFVFALQN